VAKKKSDLILEGDLEEKKNEIYESDNFKPEISFSDFNDSKNYDLANKNNLTFTGHLKKYTELNKITEKSKKEIEIQNLHFANLCRQVRLFVLPEDPSNESKRKRSYYTNFNYVVETVEKYVKGIVSKQK